MAPPSHQAPKKRIVGRSTLGSKLGKPRSKGSSAGVGSATQAASSKLKADDDKYSSILAQYAEDKKKRGLAYEEAVDGFRPRKRVKQDRVDDDGGGRVTASGSSKPYRTRSSTAKTGTSKAKALSSKATDRQWINVGHIAVEVEPELYVKKTRKGKGVVLRPVVKAGDIIKRPDDERLEELRTMGCKVDGEFWISRDMSINHVYKLIRGWVPAVAVIAEAFPDEIPICLGNGTYNRMTLKNDFSGEPILTMLTMNSRATTGKDKRKLVFAVTKELPQAVWDTLRPWEESSETLPVFYNSDGELVENGGESEDGEMFEGFEGSGYSVDVDEADRDEDICGPEADPPLDVEARSVEDRSEGTPPPSSDDESTAPPHSKWKITSRSLSPVASRQPRGLRASTVTKRCITKPHSVVGDMHNATRNVSEDAELPAPTRRTVSMPAPTLDELRRGGLRQWSMALVLYGLPERGELDQ